MITHYTVVAKEKLTDLCECVRKLISAGHEPFGSFVIDRNGNFYQPMIKREEKTSL